MHKRLLVTLGMLMAGVSPVMAAESKTGLTVDNLEKVDAQNALNNIASGTKTAGNSIITIMLYGAIILGIGFFLWGAYMAGSKDQRDEGKAKDGIKLALLGIVFMGAGVAIRKMMTGS